MRISAFFLSFPCFPSASGKLETALDKGLSIRSKTLEIPEGEETIELFFRLKLELSNGSSLSVSRNF